MTKISQLSDIGTGLAAGDEFVIRDVSDAVTPNKKVTASGFMDYVISQSASGNFSTISAGTGPLARVQTTFSGATGTITFGTASAGSLFERARIDSSGRLLVGTSSNLSNAIAVIQGVAGDPTTTGVLALRYGSSRPTGTNTLIGAIRFESTSNTANNYNYAQIRCETDGVSSSDTDIPGRLVFSTTADGASSPTERMRIAATGFMSLGNVNSATAYHIIQHPTQSQNNQNLELTNSLRSFVAAGTYGSSAGCSIQINFNDTTNRSINAGGTINASGADYAEYMTKAGDFAIAKGDVCGVTANGLLTLHYANAVSFVVKSTNPSYVGGDTWGSENVVGKKPEAEDTEALAQWEADLEAARQQVDRIAFAGQVPVNVIGATPGQYVVPIATEDGGITGIAKDEADLTLAEYIRAVGKVIAIEDDGRARIIVKVA